MPANRSPSNRIGTSIGVGPFDGGGAAPDWGPGSAHLTMPPRHMKSRGINVFFPAWDGGSRIPTPTRWRHGFSVKPGTLIEIVSSFFYPSHVLVVSISNQHSLAWGRLIESDSYRRRWDDRVQLDYTQIAQFDNFAGDCRRRNYRTAQSACSRAEHDRPSAADTSRIR